MISDELRQKKNNKNYLLLVKEDDIVSTMQDSHTMSTHRSGQKEKDREEWGWGDMT